MWATWACLRAASSHSDEIHPYNCICLAGLDYSESGNFGAKNRLAWCLNLSFGEIWAYCSGCFDDWSEWTENTPPQQWLSTSGWLLSGMEHIGSAACGHFCPHCPRPLFFWLLVEQNGTLVITAQYGAFTNLHCLWGSNQLYIPGQDTLQIKAYYWHEWDNWPTISERNSQHNGNVAHLNSFLWMGCSWLLSATNSNNFGHYLTMISE